MTIFFALLLSLLLAVPTMAAEWNFYGSVRFSTFAVDEDPGYDTELRPYIYDTQVLADSFNRNDRISGDKDTVWDQQSNSRIGATVQFNDRIGGGFEMSDSLGMRKLYATYAFGNGELLIGQTYTPASSFFYSNSVYNGDGNLLGIGQFHVGRVPMIQLKYGNLKLALVKPAVPVHEYRTFNTMRYDVDDDIYYLSGYEEFDTDVVFPKIEAAYSFKGESFFVDVFGGYQSYDLDTPLLVEDWESWADTMDMLNISQQKPETHRIESYVVGVGGGFERGPFYFRAGLHYGRNPGDYGACNPVSEYLSTKAVLAYFTSPAFVYDGSIINWQALGGLAVLGFKANDRLTFEAGYGREEYRHDTDYYSQIYSWDYSSAKGVSIFQDHNTRRYYASQCYLNATLEVTKNFVIVPEIGALYLESPVEQVSDEYRHDGSEPEMFYGGAKLQIDF